MSTPSIKRYFESTEETTNHTIKKNKTAKPLYRFKEKDSHLTLLECKHDLQYSDTKIIEYKLPLSNCSLGLYGSVSNELHFSEQEFTSLANEIKHKIPLVIFNKQVFSNHYGLVYNVPYTFSKHEHEAIPITNSKLKVWLLFSRQLTGRPGMNQVLVNRYEDGNQNIGLHSDSEGELVKGSPIVSVSIYKHPVESEFREFHIVPKEKYIEESNEGFKIILRDYTVIIMMHETQKKFKHGVPLSTTAKQDRLNLTFRESKRKGFM